MKSVILSILIVSFLSFLSCNEEVEPNFLPGEELIGAYTGKWSYKGSHDQVSSETLDMVAVVSRDSNKADRFFVSIDGYSRIIVLEGISMGSDQISGEVLVYSARYDVGVEGKEIAGSGSFYYRNNEITTLYTADPINGEWSFSFEGKDDI